MYDYDDKPRAEILDILFKPKFGAALQILKARPCTDDDIFTLTNPYHRRNLHRVSQVEVGCDGDTTQGAEQSHMRFLGDDSPTAFDRGYENWLMAEAVARHPAIHLSGLEWGVPGWVAEPWSNGTDSASPADT